MDSFLVPCKPRVKIFIVWTDGILPLRRMYSVRSIFNRIYPVTSRRTEERRILAERKK